jgi:hypothetical protein
LTAGPDAPHLFLFYQVGAKETVNKVIEANTRFRFEVGTWVAANAGFKAPNGQPLFTVGQVKATNYEEGGKKYAYQIELEDGTLVMVRTEVSADRSPNSPKLAGCSSKLQVTAGYSR